MHGASFRFFTVKVTKVLTYLDLLFFQCNWNSRRLTLAQTRKILSVSFTLKTTVQAEWFSATELFEKRLLWEQIAGKAEILLFKQPSYYFVLQFFKFKITALPLHVQKVFVNIILMQSAHEKFVSKGWSLAIVRKIKFELKLIHCFNIVVKQVRQNPCPSPTTKKLLRSHHQSSTHFVFYETKKAVLNDW